MGRLALVLCCTSFHVLRAGMSGVELGEISPSCIGSSLSSQIFIRGSQCSSSSTDYFTTYVVTLTRLCAILTVCIPCIHLTFLQRLFPPTHLSFRLCLSLKSQLLELTCLFLCLPAGSPLCSPPSVATKHNSLIIHSSCFTY